METVDVPAARSPGPAGTPTAAVRLRPRDHLNVLIGLEGLALGGCPINALDLGRVLRERGHAVDVFAIDEDVRVPLLPYARKSGFDVTVLPARASTATRARQIRQLAARHRADIVHVYGPWLGPAAAIATTSSRPRSAVVTNWTMENVSYTPQLTPLIVGTRALQAEAQRTHRSRVWLLEPPVDLDADAPDPERARQFRDETGIAADEIAAVIVSRVDSAMKAEGIGYALQALFGLDAPRLRLVVVGDGDAFETVRGDAERVNRRLSRPAVILTGARQDPHPAYAAADITLGMGGSALRALAHAKPLIVLGENGFARVFEPATAAHFYEAGFFGQEPQGDPVGHLADLLRDLLADDRRRALGAFGLAEVRARFGLETGAATLEAIYHEALAGLPAAARRWTSAAYLISRTLAHEASSALRRDPD